MVLELLFNMSIYISDIIDPENTQKIIRYFLSLKTVLVLSHGSSSWNLGSVIVESRGNSSSQPNVHESRSVHEELGRFGVGSYQTTHIDPSDLYSATEVIRNPYVLCVYTVILHWYQRDFCCLIAINGFEIDFVHVLIWTN